MEYAVYFYYLFIIILGAKLLGEAAHRLGQSSVLGELLWGVIIGGSMLNLIPNTPIIQFLAQIGAIVLLFEVGVGSHLYDFLKVGFWALLVATVGVILPFIGGYYVAVYFGINHLEAIFIGAVLTATSVGITARLFADFGKLNTKEARIVLGAAVIDDVIGLGILAVVSKMIVNGSVSAWNIIAITGTAIAFLSVSLLLGVLLMPGILELIKKMRQSQAVFIGAFSFCLIYSFLAALVGLASIVGAFIAGLVLSIGEQKAHIEEQIKPITALFVPIFFVYMGMFIDVKAFNLQLLGLLLALVLVAVVGKVLAGFTVPGKGLDRLVIGVGMVPRGEVGLIFASMGLGLGIINSSIYSVLVMVVILTTFVAPFLLKPLLKKI